MAEWTLQTDGDARSGKAVICLTETQALAAIQFLDAPPGMIDPGEREFLQQLYLLKCDMEACPMLEHVAAGMRTQWARRLGDLLARRVGLDPLAGR